MSTTPKTIGLLSGTDTKEVSIVDFAANLRRFAVSKSEKDMSILKSVLGVEAEGEASVIELAKSKGISEKGLEALQGIYRLSLGFKDELGDHGAEALKAAGLVVSDVSDEDDKSDKKEDVIKSADIPEEVRKAFELQNTELQKALEGQKELRKALEAEKDARLQKEYTEKAMNEYGMLGAPSEVGALLKQLNESDAGLAEKVEAVLKSAQERIKSGDLFSEKGVGGADSKPTAWGEIQKQAKKLVSDGKFDTEAKAITHVTMTNKKLYQQYVEEKKEGLK